MTLIDDRQRFGTRSGDLPSRAFRLVPLAALALDALLVAGSLRLAAAGRASGAIIGNPTHLPDSSLLVGACILGGWLFILATRGSYAREQFGEGIDEYKLVLSGGLMAAGALGVGSYLVHYDLSRGFFLILFLVGVPATLLGRFGLRRVVQALRRHGALGRRVLIIGGPHYIDGVAAVLGRESWLGLSVVGAMTPQDAPVELTTPGGVPVIGDASHVAAALVEHEADVLVFAPGAHTSPAQVREAVWDLEGHDVEMIVAPNLSDISRERIKMRPVGGLPLIHVTPPTWHDASRWGKRVFDVVGASAALLLASPVVLAAMLWVKLHDGGPMLFRQPRVGRQGVEFSCLKIRTMVTDAEALRADLVSDAGDASVLFKMRHDPRITRPGRLLRRLSVDELPQLVNVLRGDMSLVGPRPPLADEVARYEGHTSRRLHVRPGITGLWQVSGRADLSWEETVRLDLYYVDNWSMVQDLSILLKTVGAVLRSTGAH